MVYLCITLVLKMRCQIERFYEFDQTQSGGRCEQSGIAWKAGDWNGGNGFSAVRQSFFALASVVVRANN